MAEVVRVWEAGKCGRERESGKMGGDENRVSKEGAGRGMLSVTCHVNGLSLVSTLFLILRNFHFAP